MKTRCAPPAAELSTEALVRGYGPMVSAICRRMIRDAETARDAAQQVWLEVIRSLPGFRGEARVSTWVYRIARRVVLAVARNERLYTTRFLRDYFRGNEREPPRHEGFDKPAWVRSMCDQCLTGILHCLDNDSRLAYVLRDLALLSHEEIARILDKDAPAVRQVISRARRKLRRFLNDECALFNPRGSCRCRMKKWVEEVNLPREYAKLRALSRHGSLVRESEIVLPGKNFWEKYL